MSPRLRIYDCHARERGDLCGADDCRTCHPENFDDDGRYLWATCEECGEAFKKKDAGDIDEICGTCAQLQEEADEVDEPDNP